MRSIDRVTVKGECNRVPPMAPRGGRGKIRNRNRNRVAFVPCKVWGARPGGRGNLRNRNRKGWLHRAGEVNVQLSKASRDETTVSTRRTRRVTHNIFMIAFQLFLAPTSQASSLPKQSPVQEAAVRRAAASAGAHKSAGMASLRSLLHSHPFQAWLAHFDDGSRLQDLPPTELMEQLIKELSIGELIHSFGTGAKDGNCGMDVSLDTGEDQPYFYNQWLLQALGLVPVDPDENRFAEGAETHFWGFPPFFNVSKPDVKTAADRPVYSALNMYRIAAGNPQCGPVAAVFSRRYVGSEAIASPVDTGNYWIACGEGQTSGTLLPGVVIDCSAWSPHDGPLGVPSSLAHLLPIYSRFYNETSVVAGEQYAEFNLARLAVRLLSRRTYAHAASTRRYPPDGQASDRRLAAHETGSVKIGERGVATPPLRLSFLENTWGYLELNPALTMAQPASIKMLIGTFDRWFGTANGERLRAWCIARGWPLAWAHDPIDSMWTCSVNTSAGCALPPRWTYVHGVSPSNTRLLDPVVLARVPHGRNSTGGSGYDAAAAVFASRWSAVNRTVPDNTPMEVRRRELDKQWEGLLFGEASPPSEGVAGSLLAVEPLFAGACANEECVGVRIADSACVCGPLASASTPSGGP